MHSKPDAPARIATLEARVAQLEREMQDFSYTVSHDLRAPLRHITSFAKLVQMESAEQLNVEAQGFLGNVVDSAVRMGHMLDGLVALSRAGSVTLNPQPLALGALLQSARTAVQARYPGCAVDWQPASDLPMLHTDAALLQQALTELLDNAWKFSAKAAQPQVLLSVEPTEHGTRLLLRDNGAGFATSQSERLGLPFVRLHSAQQFPGVGLGLALARKCVQRLGGALQVRADVDKGCTVVLELPRRVELEVL